MKGVKYNSSYSCDDSGHIMAKWYPASGPPQWLIHRVCVIPTCMYSETSEASKA